MEIKLFSKQAEAYEYLCSENTEVTELLYGGGARGGKTAFGCIWQIIRRITLPGSVGLVCRERLNKLKDTTIVTMFEMLGLMGITKLVHYNEGRLIMHFPNGSKILFRELMYYPKDPEYDSLGSLAITDLFIDECQQVPAKAISVLKGRFSLLNGKDSKGNPWHTVPKALYTCNPRRNWIYTDFVKPAKEGRLPAFRKFIKALPTDNPYVDQSYLDNLLRSDKVTVQRLYYGNFEYDDDPSSLVDYDAICDLFTNEHVQAVGGRSGAADIATKGHDRFVVTAWTGNVCRLAVDKTYSPGKEVYEDVRNTMAQYGIPRSLMVVDADGIGGYLESFLPGIKEFHAGNRPSDPRYANLKAECAFILADLIQRRAMRIVSDDADQVERIKTELAVLKQADIDKDTGKKNIISKDTMKEMLGHSPDYLDALIMAMYFRRSRFSPGATINITSYGTE